MRATSVILASSASIIGLVFPFLLARQPTGLNQTILLVMMAAVAAAFIYGAGFQPVHRSLRIAISPWLSWPLILGSVTGMLLLR